MPKSTPFHPIAPERPNLSGGYGGGRIRPSDIADELFGESVSGPWLTVYMLRRFGWPNVGSDDRKNLMTWALTTPIRGLFLSVTPYLGGSNLHFGVLFNRQVERLLNSDPIRDAYYSRRHRAIRRWWKTKGIKLYAWGYGQKEGDSDELIHLFTEDLDHPGKVWGLWLRTPRMKRKGDLPPNLRGEEWWLADLIKKKHPEIKLPKMTKAELKQAQRETPFRRLAKRALRASMRDLLSEINVRDLNFNIFGQTDLRLDGKISAQYYATKPQPVLPHVDRFEGAGYTPAYWFSPAGRRERAKARRASASRKTEH